MNAISPVASFLSDFWRDQLVEHDRQALFMVLLGFLGSFAFIRLSARLGRSPRFAWWPGSVVSDSGVHLHHLVWGISLMLAAGTLGFALFASSPWLEVCAALFGIGAGLTFDEFALWVYLDDVYWAEQGRISIDATVLAVAMIGLILLGARPFEIETDTAADTIGSAIVALLVLLAVTLSFAKQRLLHGTLGLFLLPLAVYGASRIGKPGSPWAKRFYGERNARKQAKAMRRFRHERRTERFKNRFRDAIGGTTNAAYEAALAQNAATRAASNEVRDRAERAGRTG